jgi:uncharacterized protein DUF3352
MLRAASLAALSLLAALLTACGGGAASGEADPASAAPANAMAYIEVAIRPGGDTRDDALAAAGKVLATDDPEGKIRGFIDKAMAEEDADTADLDYDKDIKPWLGERAGVWFNNKLDDEGDPGGAVLVAVTDSEAALDALHKGYSNSGEKLTKRSYNGADYEVDKDGTAVGMIGDDFLAAGPEATFKATVDAQKGESLAESDRYKKALESLAEQRLAHFYVDPRQAFELAAQQSTGTDQQQLEQVRQIIPFDKLGALMGSFSADGDRLALDMAVNTEGGSALGALGKLYSTAGTPLVRELPGDTWAAFGSPKYGQSIKATLDQYAGLFGGAAAREQLKSQLGIDIEEDILSWMGDVAMFARGDSIQTVDGGVVIQVTDGAKAEKGFNKLIGLMQSAGGVDAKPVTIEGARTAFQVSDPSIPKPIVIARSDKKVVGTYGVEAAKAVLNPQSKLEDSETWAAAKDALGDEDMEPGVLVAMGPILSLVESSGASDPEYQQAKPYLDAYDVFAIGTKVSGDGGRVRIAAGLK